MTALTLAVPSKGRLQELVNGYFADAGATAIDAITAAATATVSTITIARAIPISRPASGIARPCRILRVVVM